MSVGEAGILIRGPSGAGKSTLARELVDEADRRGQFARLVCDDRVRLENRSGRLVASAVNEIAGKIEARGVGILQMPYERSAVVRLVVDGLLEESQRFPEEGESTTTICGVHLPRIATRVGPGVAALVLLQLGNLRGVKVAEL
ncbi:MAG TPA: HPr kinase/phosphatase C-terminal domain-containing protein [Beijerinckiaceae bacterium]|nr:HPr kinase/phosphatase C-terminal domain-containing protein [Beijerinckiaceae bacterium]